MRIDAYFYATVIVSRDIFAAMAQKVLAKTTLAFSLIGLVTSFDFLSSSDDFRSVDLLDSEVPVFRGNETHRDYFKLLREDGGSVLVGARNIIYNLSLPDLHEHVHEVGSKKCIDQEYLASILSTTALGGDRRLFPSVVCGSTELQKKKLGNIFFSLHFVNFSVIITYFFRGPLFLELKSSSFKILLGKVLTE